MGATQASRYLRDTNPLPVVGYKQSKTRSAFIATADYGVCPSRHLQYFGYKRVLLYTLERVPVVYERVAGAEVRDCVWRVQIIGAKGFLGADWQRGYRQYCAFCRIQVSLDLTIWGKKRHCALT